LDAPRTISETALVPGEGDLVTIPSPAGRFGRRIAGVKLVRAVTVLALAALGLVGPGARADEPRREGSVRGAVRVERVVVDAYVTNSRSDPIPDLGPADFRVRVDGRRVELESAEWIPADQPEYAPPTAEMLSGAPAAASAAAPTPEYPPGRLLVVFVQSDFQRLRLRGLMQMLNNLRGFLKDLLPTDRVAVVSFDSHAKLIQDFTNEPRKVFDAFYHAIRWENDADLETQPFPSLAAHFDFAAARKAVTVERGLALTAEALEPIPGAKAILFFGWGLQVNRYPNERRDWNDALRALYEARVSVSTLDITDADYHTLEVQLMRISDLTGGTYEKTNIFPELALSRVNRRLSGRYVLVFVKPEGKRGLHDLRVSLEGHSGQVAAREYYAD
jgi:VWFA-related protein